MTQGSNERNFFYDAQNKPAVVVFNGTPYSYVKNLQGDIVAILDSSKNVVVNYVYDAWGRPISCSGTMANTLGKINPFRYRGYVYDQETNLYYLESRYYQSAICRFLNSDTIIYEICAIGTHNVFAYCGNAPVFRCDNSGTAWWHWALAVGVVALCAVAVVATAGGVVSAAATVVAIVNGVTTAPAAATIAATAFVGSATALYATATCAALESDSIEEFMNKGDGGTIAVTAFGGAVAAAECTYQYYRQLRDRHFRINKIGMLESTNHQGNPQPAIRFEMDKANGRQSQYSFEFHTNHAHKGYQPHFQLNKVNPRDGSTSSDKYWTWWGKPIVGPHN